MSEGQEDSVGQEEKVTENLPEHEKKDDANEKAVKENGDAPSAKSSKQGSPRKDSNKSEKETPMDKKKGKAADKDSNDDDDANEKAVKENGDAPSAKSSKQGSPRKDSNKSEKETPMDKKKGKAADKDSNDEDDAEDDDEDDDVEKKKKGEKYWDWVQIPADEDSDEEKDLTVSGKRERKKVERLETKDFGTPQEEKPLEIKEGPGVKLGDIPFVDFQLNRTMACDLQGLHFLLFWRRKIMAFKSKIKKQIRQYSGDPDGKDSAENIKRKNYIERMTTTQVKDLLGMFGLDKKGLRSEINEKLENFLLKPFPTEKKIPDPKRKRSKSKTKSKKSKKSEKDKKVKKEKKKKEKKAAGEDDTEDDKEDEDGISSDSDDEDSPPKKKVKVEKSPKEKKKAADKKKATPKKESSKKSPKKETPKKTPKKSTPKKTTPKKTPKGKKAADMSDLSSDDSDDEPLAKIKKPSPPDNNEIKKVVKKLLEGANLEEVTMKTVVKKVYAKYPSFDLSDKKDFIKSVVREVIS